MRLQSLFITALAMIMAVVFTAQANTWEIDKSHTQIGFTVTHMVVTKVSGEFTEYEGEVTFNPSNLDESKIKGIVKVASITTENQRRDDHLRSADFFDAENYPHIVFESTEINKTDDGYVAVGNLTIRDVTKRIELPFSIAGPVNDPWGNTRVGLEASTTINRQEFNVTWNNTLDNGGVVVSDQVTLNLNAQLIKQN